MIKRDVVIFDLGNVLIDFDPRPVYRDFFSGRTAAFEEFFETRAIWDILDHGHNTLESWDTAFDSFIARRPELREEVDLFRRDWFKFVLGPMIDSVDIFHRLHARNIALFALTNWPAQVWPPQNHAEAIVLHDYGFLDKFQDIVVSGVEQMRKPDIEFYQLAIDRWQLDPERCIFVDDHPENIVAANRLGILGHHFTTAKSLARLLVDHGLIEE
jgi:2-haloacid dehalogenase